MASYGPRLDAVISSIDDLEKSGKCSQFSCHMIVTSNNQQRHGHSTLNYVDKSNPVNGANYIPD